MSTNQKGPMTPGTHADLVARLRAMASRFDMTSTERYEQDSEAFYAATGYMAPGKDVPMAMGGQNETERRTAHEAWIASRNRSQQQAIQEAADALAALPPPADPPHDCEVWRLEGLGCARCNKADPPTLVALVREWQRKQRGCDIENTAAAYAELDIAEAELLAYPLPAAPPVTDTPEPGEMPPSSTWVGPQPKGWPDGNNPVRWNQKPDCVIGVYCQRHGFIHGQEAEELRERLEELGDKAVNRVLDEVDARDSLAYLEATNEPTPPDAAPAAPPQEDQ